MGTNRTRTNRELLRVMLKHQDLFHSGLCYWVYIMASHNLVTRVEYENLYDYIRQNRPFKQKILKFFNLGSAFYWKRGDIKPRIDWINKHIKKLS